MAIFNSYVKLPEGKTGAFFVEIRQVCVSLAVFQYIMDIRKASYEARWIGHYNLSTKLQLGITYGSN